MQSSKAAVSQPQDILSIDLFQIAEREIAHRVVLFECEAKSLLLGRHDRLRLL